MLKVGKNVLIVLFDFYAINFYFLGDYSKDPSRFKAYLYCIDFFCILLFTWFLISRLL